MRGKKRDEAIIEEKESEKEKERQSLLVEISLHPFNKSKIDRE